MNLQERVAAAKARRAAAVLTEEQIEEGRLLTEEAEALTEARADEAKARRITGKRLEMEARAEANGGYLVEFFDLGKLLPDADMMQLPGNGVLVIRSHPPKAKQQFDRDAEQKTGEGAKTLAEIFTDLVCASVVRPVFTPAKMDEGIRFRRFLEGELGNGCPAQIGAAVLKLSGAASEEAKRAT